MSAEKQRAALTWLLRGASDEMIRGPLWDWPPADRPAVLHERRRRFKIDDEPIGDPEYS